MQYFCTKCQKRHNVSDISPDIYSIFHTEIRKNLQENFDFESQVDDPEDKKRVNALQNQLLKFCNDEEKAKAAFLIPGGQLESMVEDCQREGCNIRGRWNLTLDWLFNAYAKRAATDTQLDASAINLIPEDFRSRSVLSSDVQFFFDNEVYGRTGELVFDHATDSSNSPYPTSIGTEAILQGYLRMCPHCGARLSRAVGRAPETVVALAGVNRAGKTCCVGAIASALYHHVYDAFGIRFKIFSYDYGMNFFWNQVTQHYDKGINMDKTGTGEDDETCGTYSFYVQFGNATRVLTMVDMPGEFFGTGDNVGLTADFFKRYSGLYANIDFIWFFVGKPVAYQLPLFDLKDPSGGEIPLKRKYPTPEASTNPEIWRIMDQSYDTLDQVRACEPNRLAANLSIIADGLHSMGKPMPPIMVIMTKAEIKIDQVEEQLMNQKAIFPPHSIAEFNRQNIQRILKKDASGFYIDEHYLFMAGSNARDVFRIRAKGFIQAIDQVFPHRFYTAISSYGHGAATSDSMNAVPPTPYNEIMPLIWTLAVSGAAKVRQSCQWVKTNIFRVPTGQENGFADVWFSAPDYIRGYFPTGNNPEVNKDYEIKYRSAATNLLFENATEDVLRYKASIFEHTKK